MAFCDVVSLIDYWNDYPPVHMLLRAFVGYEGRGKSDKESGSDSVPKNNPTDFEQAMFMQMPGMKTSELPDWHRNAIDRVLKEKKKK